MKKWLNRFLLVGLTAAVFVSCKKDENRITFDGGKAPVLTATKTAITLSLLTKGNEAVKFSWTNPEYQFTTGISSMDVSYRLEIDTVGANFTNPKRYSTKINNDLSFSITEEAFNDILQNQMGLDSSMRHDIEVRVVAYIANVNYTSATDKVSNVIKYLQVKPYFIPPKVTPPASNKLFITGSATPANWQCGCGEPELNTQKFTRVTNTLYVLDRINLKAGQSYLLLPRYGTWSAVSPDPNKYGGTGGNNNNNPNGDNFKADGADLKAPDATADYKIEVNFQTGRFTVTKLD